MASATVPSLPLALPLEQVVSSYRLTNMLWTGSYVVLVYDYILTLDDEISYIWTGGWTRARILYLINRYWPMLNLIPSIISLNLENPGSRFCNFAYAWFTFANVVTQFTSAVILIIRVYAMYGSSKKLLYSLLALLVVVLSMQGVLTSLMSGASIKLQPISHASGCLPGHWIIRPWIYGIPAGVFDGLLLVLVIVKSVKYFLNQDQYTPHLFFVLLKDSVLYFGTTFMVLVGNLIMYVVGGEALFVALPQTLIVTESIIGCRMLLNVKKTVRPWDAEPWRDEDSAAFSAVVRPLSFFRNVNMTVRTLLPLLPTTSQNEAT